jgi:hypothetical protein
MVDVDLEDAAGEMVAVLIAGAALDQHGDFVRAYTELDHGELAGPELLPVRLAKACVTVLSVAGAGISLFTAMSRVPIGASDEYAADAERLQFTLGQGPCLAAHEAREPVLADTRLIAERWPEYHQRLTDKTPFRAVAAFPLPAGFSDFATLDLFHRDSADLGRLTQANVGGVTRQISLALMQDQLGLQPDQLPRWLETPAARTRNMVFIAIGILDVALRLTPSNALAVLRAHAYATDRSVDDDPRDVVERRIPARELRLEGNL